MAFTWCALWRAGGQGGGLGGGLHLCLQELLSQGLLATLELTLRAGESDVSSLPLRSLGLGHLEHSLSLVQVAGSISFLAFLAFSWRVRAGLRGSCW